MHCLIVCDQSSIGMFESAVVETLVSVLRSKAHRVRVRDLRSIGWGLGLESAPPETLADAAAEEQDQVRWAEAVFFIHPTRWFSVPAGLSAYLANVFVQGFAYHFGADGLIPLLFGKKVCFIAEGGDEPAGRAAMERYAEVGMLAALGRGLGHGAFRLSGLEVTGHRYIRSTPVLGMEALKLLIGECLELAATLRTEPVGGPPGPGA
ncbi:MAG: NAD(P)H-dependent oxidoreductase [Elusimicrobia bacterium]|nr:NAD(P)H-dependent oxidoreductase [Elusimicrobiota bacterium]